MAEKSSKQKSTSSKAATATTTTTITDIPPPKQRMVENFLLIWVDGNIDKSNKDCQNTLAQLRSVVNNVNLCTQPDQCIQFLNNIKDEKAFVIVSGALGQKLVFDIHAMPQLDAIYIFCGNQSRHEQWAKEWAKVQGVHTDIKPICEALQVAVKQCNQDTIAVSFIAIGEEGSNQNTNQLDPTFMYTQIFKEILLEMEHNHRTIKGFLVYCRELYDDNVEELKLINEFESKYQPNLSIEWYTRECFTYNMLNRALRTMEADTIIAMGFFIRDLHGQIKQLHKRQVDSYHGKTFIVYRGQGLSTTDFEKLSKTKGGLMSFNSFLSTSLDRQVSIRFAERALVKTDTVGILFKMAVDPSTSTPFAAINEVSYFKTEKEVLFSMHTVFRIGEIKKMDNNNRIYQVELELTAEDDQQLRTLTDRIRQETDDSTGWRRLGKLLIKIGHFDKAADLYTLLLEQTSDEDEKTVYYNHLGCVKNNQGDYEKAIWYYEKGMEIKQKTLPPNHFSLATSYNSLAGVYYHMKDYPKALSFYEKTRKIFEKTLPSNHPTLAACYSNIGVICINMGEYSKALSFYKRALEIEEKTLLPNHPDLAISYNNVGTAYQRMGEYSEALSFFEKTLDIEEKTLAPNHPSLAISYNNIGTTYQKKREYLKALSFYERAMAILEHSLPHNHPKLQTVRENMESVKKKL